jgi:hypothetical protein
MGKINQTGKNQLTEHRKRCPEMYGNRTSGASVAWHNAGVGDTTEPADPPFTRYAHSSCEQRQFA